MEPITMRSAPGLPPLYILGVLEKRCIIRKEESFQDYELYLNTGRDKQTDCIVQNYACLRQTIRKVNRDSRVSRTNIGTACQDGKLQEGG
jgi:hypothetical protein